MWERLLALVRRHPVSTYFVLAFAISWIGTLAVIGVPFQMPAPPEETARLFPAVFLATVVGPTLASLVLTAMVAGWAGFRDYFARLLKWRVRLRWYALALLIAPLSVNLTLLALTLASPRFLPAMPTLNGGTLALLAIGLATGLLEETGWTGFAVLRLLRYHGALWTGFAVGMLWGAWHFVSNVWAAPATGSLPLVLFMPVLLFTFLPPYRVLMVWIYERTGSLLVSVLMHASLIVFWLMATPPGIAGDAMTIWYMSWGAVLWLVVAAVFAMERRAVRGPSPPEGLSARGGA
jgi:membrane protease YdiL (CAAX protease family)